MPPLVLDGASLNEHAGFRFAVFERRGGRWPELATQDDRRWMGRFLGRIHAVGAVQRFEHRPALSIERLGYDPVDELLASDWIPGHLIESYETLTSDLLAVI